MKNTKWIVLADNDGTIRDTNGVKDAMLNDFCQREFGESFSNIQATEMHRQMHGRPMNEIFVKIAQSIYHKEITLAEGQEITERLNDYIRAEYVSRPVYPGALEFFKKLKAMGIPLYVLTGMEPDMVDAGLTAHGMKDLFIETLGAPATKEENISRVLTLYPGTRIIAMGDAMSEYRATMAHPGTIFLAFDMENRKKRVFPEDVKVYTAYNNELYQDLISKMN